MFNPKPTSIANFTLIRQDEDCLRADFKSEVWSPKNCIETDLNILLNTMKKGGTRGINVMNGQRCKTFGLVSGSKRRRFKMVAVFQRIFQFLKKKRASKFSRGEFSFDREQEKNFFKLKYEDPGNEF